MRIWDSRNSHSNWHDEVYKRVNTLLHFELVAGKNY